MQNNPQAGKHRHSVGSVNLKNHLQGMAVPGLSVCKTDPVPATAARFSASNNNQQFHVRFQNSEVDDKTKRQKSLDIESSLESLCLQMMEHALGP